MPIRAIRVKKLPSITSASFYDYAGPFSANPGPRSLFDMGLSFKLNFSHHIVCSLHWGWQKESRNQEHTHRNGSILRSAFFVLTSTSQLKWTESALRCSSPTIDCLQRDLCLGLKTRARTDPHFHANQEESDGRIQVVVTFHFLAPFPLPLAGQFEVVIVIEVVTEAMVGRTEFLTGAIASEPTVGKRNLSTRAKWRSSSSARGSVLENRLTPPTFLEMAIYRQPRARFPVFRVADHSLCSAGK